MRRVVWLEGRRRMGMEVGLGVGLGREGRGRLEVSRVGTSFDERERSGEIWKLTLHAFPFEQTLLEEMTSLLRGRSLSSILRRVSRVVPPSFLVSTPLTTNPPLSSPSDLLCDLTVRELKAGKVALRPLPHKDLPFGDLFETFLMSWSCLNSLG